MLPRVVADELGFRHAFGDFAPQIILSLVTGGGSDGLLQTAQRAPKRR